MKKFLIILAEVLLIKFSYSQDLVQDPGFDTNDPCRIPFGCNFLSCFGTCDPYWTANSGAGDNVDPILCPDGDVHHGIPANECLGAHGTQYLSSTPNNARYV